MKKRRNISRSLILILVFGFVSWAIWQKVYIGIMIRLGIWEALALFAVIVIIMFLLLDHLFNREK